MPEPNDMTKMFSVGSYSTNGSNDTDNVPGNYYVPPPWTSNEFITITVASNIRIVLCTLALLANVLVLLLQLKLKSFLKTFFVFGLSLSIADGAYALGVLLETYVFVYRYDAGVSPVPFSALATVGHFQSYVCVILVAVDRYLALCAFPMRYRTMVSLKKYYVISALCWCFSFAYGFAIRYAFPPGHYFGSLETFITPSAAIIIYCFIYLKLYVSTSRSMQRMADLGREETKRRHKQSRKLLFAISLILLTNFVLLMPSRVFNLYLSLDPIRFLYFENILLVNMFYNLQTLNAVVNPMIYWWQVLLRDRPQCRRRKKFQSSSDTQTVVDCSTANEDIEIGMVNVAMETT